MKDSGKIVNISFDVDNMIIDAPCPECIYNELSEEQYKNLIVLVFSTCVNLRDYYFEVKEDGKSRKSKKKSRQKDIQKSC